MPWPKDVRRRDLRIDHYRGSGAGGQHRNKTDSACRITHLPTGLQASCEVHRSQARNRAEAFRKLARQLVPRMREALSDARPDAKSSERIRTYSETRGEVKDHRTGAVARYEDVLDGDLDRILEVPPRG